MSLQCPYSPPYVTAHYIERPTMDACMLHVPCPTSGDYGSPSSGDSAVFYCYVPSSIAMCSCPSCCPPPLRCINALPTTLDTLSTQIKNPGNSTIQQIRKELQWTEVDRRTEGDPRSACSALKQVFQTLWALQIPVPQNSHSCQELWSSIAAFLKPPTRNPLLKPKEVLLTSVLRNKIQFLKNF